MKKINKILSVLLATILMLSLFPVSLAHASDNTITFSAETDVISAKAGDVVNVNINMTEISNLGALTLVVNYDNTALKILSATSNSKYGYEEFNTAYANNKLAYLVVSTETKAVSGTLFTIQFEVLKDGCTEISLSVDEIVDIDLNALSCSAKSTKIHNYDNGAVTPPTCTEQGYTTYTCSCGDSYADNYVDVLGHSFSDWTTENGPTCTETGLEKRVCSVCSETEENELSATGHDYDYENGVLTRPTDSAKGYYTYTCKNDSNHTTTEEVESADYTEYDKAAQKIAGYFTNPNLTSASKQLINEELKKFAQNNSEYCDNNGNLRRDLIASEQEIVDNATESANELIDVVDGIIANCEAGNHDVRAYTSDDNATCTEDGTKRGNCVVCGKEVVATDENNLAFGHDMIIDEAVPATCTETGLTEGSHCSRCDDATTAQETFPALGHSYNLVVTPPTCTETGYTTHTCSACDDTYIDNYVDATGHSYSSEITTAPTHTENGVMTYTCACGDSYTETINATGDHYYVPTVTAPTCTEGGYTTYNCVCGDTYVDDETPANGHDYNGIVTAPTCTETGYTTYTCSICDDTYVDDETPANGHDYNAVVTAPTCTETGYTTYTCTACDDTYVDDETPANGHDYNAVVTAPTCTETGYTTYTCTACDDTYVDDKTSASGHSFSNGNCTVCGETDPDYYVFSVKTPSRTKIRNKDGIILHTEIEGNAPADSYVVWTSSNSNFDKTVMNKGTSLRVIANNKGNTTFTATLYDANGNELATDSVTLYSDSGFFQKIGGFFRSLFGATKMYEA